MRLALITPPHRSIGSRVPGEPLPPLGLLSFGGPLIDAGQQVRLLNADIIADLCADPPEAVLIGDSGATCAHPTVPDPTTLIRVALPQIKISCGGGFPNCHGADVRLEAPATDVFVRGKGEVAALIAAPALIAARATGTPLDTIPALPSAAMAPPKPPLPPPCWRASPVPASAGSGSTSPMKTRSLKAWLAFLKALIATGVKISSPGSTRADAIVRDVDIPQLDKQAGCLRFLMGFRGTDEATLTAVQNGGTRAKDQQATTRLHTCSAKTPIR